MAYVSRTVQDDVKKLRDALEFEFCRGYLFWGEEDYLRRHYTGVLRDKIKSEGMEEFNFVLLDFEEGAQISEIAENLLTPPVFTSHKMIEVRGLDILNLKKDEEKELISAIDSRGSDTVLLFNFNADALDLTVKKTRERKIIRDLSEKLFFVQFARQPKQKLVSWTDRIFSSENVRIRDVDISKMIDLCDFSMTRLKNESEKLICRAKSQNLEEIVPEWIDKTVKPSAENELFDLSDALLEMDKTRAVEIFENLVGQNFDPSVILATLSRAIVSESVFFSARKSGKSRNDAAALSEVPVWKSDKYDVALSKRTEEGICKSVRDVFECEVKLKSEAGDKIFLVERLLFTLLSEENR